MHWIIAIYGLFCIVGGIIGFARAHSLISLLVGGIGGIFLLGCAWGMAKGSRLAAFFALLISLAFGIRFLVALLAQFKVMPNLLMVILSAIGAVAALLALSRGKTPR